MAGDEAEHSKAMAGPGFSPDPASETPLSGAEYQPAGELESAEAKSQSEPEITVAPPAEGEPSAITSPGAQEQSEEQIPMDAEEPEAGVTPGLASTVPDADAAYPPGPARNIPGAAGEQTKPRSRFPSLAVTAIAGGLLGFGGTYALRSFEGTQIGGVASEDHTGALNARIEAIEGKADAASDASRKALAELETRVAAAESAANKAADSANTAQADLQKEFAARPAVQEPTAGANSSEAPDFGPLNERIGTLEQKLTSLESALAAPKGELRARQQDRESPAAKQDTHAQTVAIVAQSLLHKLEAGGKFPDELAALETLGVSVDSLAPLRAVSGSAVSSERQLTSQFAALAPAIIASDPANQASPNENFLDRVTRHAKGLVHIRRVGEAEIMDTEGLVTRIENALADHDLEAAYKAWKELPSAAMTKSESWGEAAKTRLDAINAARSIEAEAVAVLGKSKS